MPAHTIQFNIQRFKPGHIDEPFFQTFMVDVNPQTTVLDALETIRLTQDASLMYRHSCHHSACGTCGCMINGVAKLSCVTNVAALQTDVITLEPLTGFPKLGDLAVDMGDFFRNIDADFSCLKPAKSSDTADDCTRQQLENCIECGCCVSACPQAHTGADFMGPAALAAIHVEAQKYPQKQPALLTAAAGPRGERHCERVLACSRVCPTGVYPARHVADLRRQIQRRSDRQ